MQKIADQNTAKIMKMVILHRIFSKDPFMYLHINPNGACPKCSSHK